VSNKEHFEGFVSCDVITQYDVIQLCDVINNVTNRLLLGTFL